MAEVPVELAHRAVGMQLQALFAAGIADDHQRLAVGQPLAVAVAHAVGHAVLAYRAFPQRHGEGLAAHVEQRAVAGRVQLRGAHVRLGRHEAPRRLHARADHLDVERVVLVALGVQQPQLRGALVDDAPAVALRMARVAVGMVGVAAQAAAVGQARIEVAHTFGIGQEVHTLADPHRATEVALQFTHAPELAAAAGVDPQVPGRAAAVALPARRVGGVAADDPRPAEAPRQVVDLAQPQRLRHAAGRVEAEGLVVAEEGLSVGADEQDVALRRPAAHQRVRAQPGQPPAGPALGRHQLHLGVLLVAADVGQPAAVGRQAGRGRLRQPGGQAPRDAAVRAGQPQVVVADEDDAVALQRGLAQVGWVAHGRGGSDGSN